MGERKRPRAPLLLATGAILLGVFILLSAAVFLLGSAMSLFGLALVGFGILYIAAGLSFAKESKLSWFLSSTASLAIIPLALLSTLLVGVASPGMVTFWRGVLAASTTFLVLVLLARHFLRASAVAA